MRNLDKLYNIKLNIPKFIKYLIPKFIKRKINKKFFPYYFLLTDYQKLPLSNYVNINNLERQKDLIEKFTINQKQNSFMTCPYLHQLILMKYNPNDNFSFLDMGSDELEAKGNGGTRQMHNYVSLNYADKISTPTDEHDYKQPKISEEMTIEKLQQMRDQEYSNLTMKK